MSIGLFVDLHNLYFTTEKTFPGRAILYKSYLERLGGDVKRKIAYGTFIDKELTSFIAALKHLGFDTRLQQLRIMSSGRAQPFDWAAGITLDVIQIVEKRQLETVVFGSSSLSLLPVIEYVKSQGTRVAIMSCGVPRELRSSVDEVIEITEDLTYEKPK